MYLEHFDAGCWFINSNLSYYSNFHANSLIANEELLNEINEEILFELFTIWYTICLVSC